jgi:uncharacterized protein with FMN-binding domain
MRRITTWLLSTISALVLLFSYHTSTTSTAAGIVATAGDANTGSATGATGSSSGTPSDGTYTGDAVTTRYGPVQVEITVSNGQITSSAVTQVPWGNGRDQQINGYAVPILNDEVVRAQGSGIDMVSGATYTSEGYVQSLQSAIDQANL